LHGKYAKTPENQKCPRHDKRCELISETGHWYCQNSNESGSANGMKEMAICVALRRLMPSDVPSVRLRSIRLAAHPHLEHLLPCHCPPTPCRRTSLQRPGNKTYEESTIGVGLTATEGSAGRTFQAGIRWISRRQGVGNRRLYWRTPRIHDDAATKKGTKTEAGMDVD
jgi:hypothetical protein